MTESRMACPKCRTADTLYSLEASTTAYPITFDADGVYEYTGEPSETWDDATEYSDDLYCKACAWFGSSAQLIDLAEKPCRHCGRGIINEGGRWIDPEAIGDDGIWRETCDQHDTFTAEHEPEVID